MSDRRTEIRNAYKQTGGHAGFYDGMMTCSTIMGKAICRLVWNMDCEKNYAYLERALSGVPERFAGKLLEVPVGTGVLTMPVYRGLPGADGGYSFIGTLAEDDRLAAQSTGSRRGALRTRAGAHTIKKHMGRI